MTKTASISTTTREGLLVLDKSGKTNVSSYRFLGIRVNPLKISELHALAAEAIEKDRKTLIACHNLHSLYIFHHDAKMRRFHDRVDFVHIDGMGIVLLGRLLGHPLERQHRVTYLDWIKPLLTEAASRRWRVFYLGMRASICSGIQDILHREMPELEFGTAHWNIEHVQKSSLRQEVLQTIDAFQPQILFVGLGMPRQERWILDNYDRLAANVILPCGATMDYLAGAVPTPPRWTGKYGVEWLFRLLSEPRHLWRRYLIEPWFIFWLFVTEIIRFRISGEREQK
jgi:N-acetylglucosaminyldiphosphoundecaprenol N-acetyl-beta-D-mannosaminyltransferase